MWIESVATGFVQAGPPEAIDEILRTVPVVLIEIRGLIWTELPGLRTGD